MTVVVSDTGPLNYLLLCQAADILPKLFGEVIVPMAVLVDLPTIMSALTRTTFQIDPKLIRKVLEDDARRRGQ